MYTKITYVGTLKGVRGLWCGFKPRGLKVSEERVILYPEDGKELMKDEERFGAVWLRDDDVQENYIEVDPLPEPEEIMESDGEETEEEVIEEDQE